MKTKNLQIQNKISELHRINQVIDALFMEWELPVKSKFKVILAVEEVFANIVNYAYDIREQPIDLQFLFENEMLTIRVLDYGKPFNPLQFDSEAEIKKPIEEKESGGIGIHIIKSVMNEINYQRKNGRNILTLKKTF
ncbi:MAG: ATP-binding protein [Bacteroidales bacterium]|nr:ATP-binding protein [Bacteroidales bacterium]